MENQEEEESGSFSRTTSAIYIEGLLREHYVKFLESGKVPEAGERPANYVKKPESKAKGLDELLSSTFAMKSLELADFFDKTKHPRSNVFSWVVSAEWKNGVITKREHKVI